MAHFQKVHPLVALRDAAFEASHGAHQRMIHEQILYRNEEAESWYQRHLPFAAKRSIDPRIHKAIDKMVPAFASELTKVEIQAEKSTQTDEDNLLIDDLRRYLGAHEQADEEAERLETLIYDNRIMGNCMSKLRYEPRTGIVQGLAINPLSFAPDPSCYSMAFTDSCEYVCHTNYHNEFHVGLKYPGAPIRAGHSRANRSTSAVEHLMGANVRVDELWIQPELAEYCGVKVNKKTRMVTATIVDDEPFRATANLLWYPSFPFAGWRTFSRLGTDKVTEFWGDGYATKMEGEQKLYDHQLGQWLNIVENLPVGRVATTHGTLDSDQILNVHGANIKLNKNKKLGEDFQFIPPGEAPVSLYQATMAVRDMLDQNSPSLSPVYSGEQPSGSGGSGRQVIALQQATFNQLLAQFQAWNHCRLRRTGIRVHLIQQFGRRPKSPHKWRRGIDLPDSMPEDARFVGFNVSVPDSTGIPNTVLGRLQILQILNGLGYALSPQRTIDFLKLDTAFGISENDLLQSAPVGPNGEPMNEGAAAGMPEALGIT